MKQNDKISFNFYLCIFQLNVSLSFPCNYAMAIKLIITEWHKPYNITRNKEAVVSGVLYARGILAKCLTS